MIQMEKRIRRCEKVFATFSQYLIQFSKLSKLWQKLSKLEKCLSNEEGLHKVCSLDCLTRCDCSTTVTEWQGNYFREEWAVHETWNLFRFTLHSEHLHSFNLCCLLCSLTRRRRFFLHPLNVPFSLHVHKFSTFFFHLNFHKALARTKQCSNEMSEVDFFHHCRPIWEGFLLYYCVKSQIKPGRGRRGYFSK